MSQQRRGSARGSPVSGLPGPSAAAAASSQENQMRGIPLPGMVPSHSVHGSPMHGNPIHGFVNPLGPAGPAGLAHPGSHPLAIPGISHHPSSVHQVHRASIFLRSNKEISCLGARPKDTRRSHQALRTRRTPRH
ncbi:uncharacterized protein LOC112494649 [Cephus cinctus]|uniref:Uncharacterized protein LOC112494649 n=1 Tax=Cephus cinctus TaxID=211228 RepID=A0AAJ7RL57_CEPCN|nr:uncharacterized protein LOC112494649 [Cephus cinctus]